MKRNLIFAIAILSGHIVMAQQKVTISGEVAGWTDSLSISVTDNEGYQEDVFGKQRVSNGNFSLQVSTRIPRMVNVNFSQKNLKTGKAGGKEYNWRKLATLRVMLDESPLHISLTKEQLLSDKSKAYERQVVSGGKAQQQFREYLDYVNKSETLADSLCLAQALAWFANGGIEDSIKDLKAAATKAEAELQRQKDQFIAEHPDYLVSAALLAQKPYHAFSYTNAAFDRLYAALQNNTDTLHMGFLKRNLDLVHRFGLGTSYKDFEGKTKDNQTVKLSSLMQPNKMTLIDFWASWCGPCRNAIPKVKAMQEKYGDKLQVISCSVDEKEQNWRKAEAEEKMSWPQLLASQETMKQVLGPYYALSSIPCLVLIDTEGKIICVTNDPAIINEKLK